MAVFDKLRGTLETIFQLSLGGPNVKNNAGVVEMRSADDSAFVITRGLDPLAAQDYVTKTYGDTNYGGGAGGAAEQLIRFAVGLATVASVTQIPAFARVTKSRVEITTAYDNAAKLDIGKSFVSPNSVQTQNEMDETLIDAYAKEQDLDWGVGAATVNATISGGVPTVGAAIVTVWYVMTPNP